MKTMLLTLWLVLVMFSGAARGEVVQVFDHSLWDGLLQRHVKWLPGGYATRVDYEGLIREKTVLQRYLALLSAVPEKQFDQWAREEQLAFLLNTYNAFTVQLIISQYPDVLSIKDLGSLIRSPWKKPFVPLFGGMATLDEIEHGRMRESGRYRDPRVHFAANCASIGCPALRPEAYRGAILDAQLDDQARRFLADKSRNRFQGNRLEISPIFRWYREDFGQGFRGDKSLQDFLSRHAAILGLTAADVQKLHAGEIAIAFRDYDWRLNDKRLNDKRK